MSNPQMPQPLKQEERIVVHLAMPLATRWCLTIPDSVRIVVWS
jgi:hypothetical protein